MDIRKTRACVERPGHSPATRTLRSRAQDVLSEMPDILERLLRDKRSRIEGQKRVSCFHRWRDDFTRTPIDVLRKREFLIGRVT